MARGYEQLGDEALDDLEATLVEARDGEPFSRPDDAPYALQVVIDDVRAEQLKRLENGEES